MTMSAEHARAPARCAERERAGVAPAERARLGKERDNGGSTVEASRHGTLDGLRSRTHLTGLRYCGLRPTGSPTIVRHAGRAWLSGVLRCGLVHVCPVCSPRIRAERARDVEAALSAHRARGGDVLLLTLTAPHRPGDRLSDLLSALRSAHSALWKGRKVRTHRDALGWHGLIRSWEITAGASGWHPHLHALLLVDRVEDWQAVALRAVLSERWRATVTAAGLDEPDAVAGCDVRRVTADDDATLAGYLLKPGGGFGAAADLARGDLKTPRHARLSIGDLARAVADRDDDATRRWREYESATRGLRLVQWSPGLRDRLGLGDELPDAALLDDPPPAWADLDDPAPAAPLEDDEPLLVALLDEPPPPPEVVLRLPPELVRTLATRRLTSRALDLAAAIPDRDDARTALLDLVGDVGCAISCRSVRDRR